MNTEVHGTVERGYESVRAAFAEAQRDDDGGAQLAVYRFGECVVDLWAGTDVVNQKPFPGDGIGVLTSATKGLAATALHLLAERGQIDLAKPVSAYWPEFAQNGKENITVAHTLYHSAGLPAFPENDGISPADLMDWDRSTASLAAAPQLWRAGSAFMYHSFTFGFLVGEIVRRVSGKSVGTYFQDEIAGPLGLDLWIGLPEEYEPRVVPQIVTVPDLSADQVSSMLASYGLDVTDPITQATVQVASQGFEAFNRLNTREGHAAEIPSGNGIGDARSLARLYASLLGKVDGVRILNEATLANVSASRTDNLPLAGGFAHLPDPFPLRFGLGYEVNRTGVPMLGPTSFGHTGAGGRLSFADPESGISVGYICNNMTWESTNGPDVRWLGWTRALREVAARQAA